MENLNKTLTQIMEAHSAPSFDSPQALEEALWQGKLQTLNAQKEPPNGYDCPLCGNKQVTFRLREEKDGLVAVPCKCVQIRRCIRRMGESGLGDALRTCTFESFRAQEDWQKRLLKTARDYAAAPSGWLSILGQSGCGKTHLCTAVCNQLLARGEQVLYFAWREEAARLKAAQPERREALLEQYLQAPYLYIDDLLKTARGADGTVQPTAGDLNLAFTILGYRYARKKPTILSSEYGIAELLGLDEAIGSRIAEMSGRNLCGVRRDPKRNYRLRGIQEV